MTYDTTAIVLRFVVMIASLSVHEFAHAITAHWLGDRTPKREGRLTLNPMAHIDPVGTILMPGIQALTGIPTIGWARPVMVNVSALRKLSSQRLAYAIVAAAGPLSNLALAILAAAALSTGYRGLPTGGRELLSMMFMANVGLFVFNLLPVPGLDGSRLLPPSLDRWQRRVQPYSWAVLLIIVAVPAISRVVIGVPMRFISGSILSLFGLTAS
jgi:Zn-dependent protease